MLPALLWQMMFLAAPCCAILAISLLSSGEQGGFERPWTLENYWQLAGFGPFGFEPLYPMILLRSFLFALATTLLCAGISLPLAFFIAGLSRQGRLAAIVLLTAPVWTNLLVRTYAWQILLGPEGWIARAAAGLGFVERGAALYPSIGAVLVCLVCDFLPFAALPLYASVEKLDRALVDAARDLGASRGAMFRHAIYPQIKPGLWAGVIFVFLPALGQFIIPDLLGGSRTVLLGSLLQQQFGAGRDWPFGAAAAACSLFLIVAAASLYLRHAGKERA